MAKDKVAVGLITLGCAKNVVDSEYMLAELGAAGFTLTEDLSQARAIVVNTCAFIQPAKEESIETILEAARFKETGRCEVLAVVGCMAQRYSKELGREMPEVDIFLGLGQQQRRLGEELKAALGLELTPRLKRLSPRVVETANQGWAYLKISEGCNNRCNYCAIPLIRGNLKSRPEAEIVGEAVYLESLGVKELNLIAQDVTAYGLDCGREGALNHLLKSILAETGIPWIRLLYTHPAHLNHSLLELIAENNRLLPYLDMPIQHASDRILVAMGRGVKKKEMLEKIELARRILNRPVLRTTVLVGFPGERKAEFAELVEFIEQVRFDRLGGFIYSREEGTPAAALRDSVPRAEKQRRLETVLEIQREISAAANASRVGEVFQVLVERPVDPNEAPSPEYLWAGRSSAHAPEVDGVVYLALGPDVEERKIRPGRMARVRITDSGDYDLFGRIEPD